MNRITKIVLRWLAVALMAGSFGANANLLGDTINASGAGLSPASATIGPGVEFIGVSNWLQFDFGASTLTVTSTFPGSFPFALWGTYTFSGFDTVITSLSIASNNGFSGPMVSAGGFTFTSNSISLDMNTATTTAAFQGASVTFNIGLATTPTVPEPATLALIGLGLSGLALTRRRKSH